MGSDISIYCNVTGYPTPEITWYKDNRLIEASEHIVVTGNVSENLISKVNDSKHVIFLDPQHITIADAQPFDSGNYRCVAKNDYSHAFAAEVISVEGE